MGIPVFLVERVAVFLNIETLKRGGFQYNVWTNLNSPNKNHFDDWVRAQATAGHILLYDGPAVGDNRAADGKRDDRITRQPNMELVDGKEPWRDCKDR